MRGGRSLCSALAVLLLLAGAAPAQGRRFSLTPIFIRITGYLGPKKERPILLTSWKINRGRTVYHLHVIKLEVLSGNIAYFNIVEQLEPYDPAFSFGGDNRAVEAFERAPPGETLVIMGYLRLDASIRTFMMDTVAPLAVGSPTPETR
jgi:hypothetical protein